jgi:hypothetical protein
VQEDAGHPSYQGGGQEKNYQKREGRGGEAQGIADPKKLMGFWGVELLKLIF